MQEYEQTTTNSKNYNLCSGEACTLKFYCQLPQCASQTGMYSRGVNDFGLLLAF